MSTPSALVALAQAILKDASTLDEHFRTQNLPQPAFDVHAPPRIAFSQPDLIQAHESLLANTKELHHLALGPIDSLRQIASIVSQPFIFHLLMSLTPLMFATSMELERWQSSIV